MRPRRRIEFERVMFKRAWTASELAPKLGISVFVCRRYLRRYFNFGLLVRAPDGTQLYYAVKCFLKPPSGLEECPQCDGILEVYERKCGCIFKLCMQDETHSNFTYCQSHSAITSRLQLDDKGCKKEVNNLERRDKS